MKMRRNRFASFAWGVLLYALIVILWGVVVRATGSGAGCGSHWPSCNGELLPLFEEQETIIEFSHRLTSGFFGLVSIVLVVWAFRAYPKGSLIRKGALWGLVFTIVEGLVGAYLVRLELVADNASMARAVWMALHLVNTLFLLAAFTLTAWWASGGNPLRLRGQGMVTLVLGIGFLAMILLSMSGGVTALGDTLFPATSIAEGLLQDFDPNGHFLIQLRTIHPILAVITGLYLHWAARLVTKLRPSPQTARFSQVLLGLFVLQLLVGLLNIGLLAPISVQLIHLLLADLLWITLLLLSAEALSDKAKQQAPVKWVPLPR
jgi:heme A synthase